MSPAYVRLHGWYIADLVALADMEDFIQMHGVVFEGQCEEDLEHQAIRDILGHDVAGGVVAGRLRPLGRNPAGRHGGLRRSSSTPAARRMGTESLTLRSDLVRQDELHPHVDGGGDGRAILGGADVVLQTHLQA